MTEDLRLKFLFEFFLDGEISEKVLTEKIIPYRKDYSMAPKKISLRDLKKKQLSAIKRGIKQRHPPQTKTYDFKMNNLQATKIGPKTALVTGTSGALKAESFDYEGLGRIYLEGKILKEDLNKFILTEDASQVVRAVRLARLGSGILKAVKSTNPIAAVGMKCLGIACSAALPHISQALRNINSNKTLDHNKRAQIANYIDIAEKFMNVAL